MIRADYVVVGSGLTGAVIARTLHDAGREVVLLERRDHPGGNVHDFIHPSGVRIHAYGPHYFRTSSPRVWDFVNRFASFHPYQAKLLSLVDGREEHWPIAASYIDKHVGPHWRPQFTGTPANFEQAALSLMPRVVYEKFVKEYNEKQWGVPATQLAADLCKRFDVRADDDPRLTPHAKHQGIPAHGYAAMMSAMIAGIPLHLNFDYLLRRGEVEARQLLIFTGPIDAFFGHDLGCLTYRGQQRAHRHLPSVDLAQSCGQLNNPQHAGGPHIRTLEWKHMMPPEQRANVQGTVLTTETPFTPSDPTHFEYPFPDAANHALYERYRARADAMPGILIAGRLGEYRYFDMDQAIARAMLLAQRLLDGASDAQDHHGNGGTMP